jgi:hypothetical protein
MECAGAYAVFDGIQSPVTQTFGLAIFAELSPAALAYSQKSRALGLNSSKVTLMVSGFRFQVSDFRRALD